MENLSKLKCVSNAQVLILSHCAFHLGICNKETLPFYKSVREKSMVVISFNGTHDHFHSGYHKSKIIAKTFSTHTYNPQAHLFQN